jgi:hypothetical protein
VQEEEPAAWFTVKVMPAMVMVPLRVVVFGFVWKLYPTVPLPLPEAPEVMVIQEAFEVADQAHPPGAKTLTEPDPAVAGTLVLVPERL